MLGYLHHRSVLSCSHGGIVFVPHRFFRTLETDAHPVITVQDLTLEATIVGCTQMGPGLKPCTRVVRILTGEARGIRVDGQTPLLSSLRALTDGVPPGFVTAGPDPVTTLRTEHPGLSSAPSEADEKLQELGRELAWELGVAAVDVAGILDPTPVSDGIGAFMSLRAGDPWGAVLSLLSMLPWVGDALGKTAKGRRALKRIKRIEEQIAQVKTKFSTGKRVDPDLRALAPDEKEAAEILRRNGYTEQKTRQVLESGRDFKPWKGKKGDRVYKVVDKKAPRTGRTLESPYWITEDEYKRLQTKHYKNGTWDHAGVKKDLAVPCTNPCDDWVSSTLTKDADGATSTTLPGTDWQYDRVSQDVIRRRPAAHYGGGGLQVHPDSSSLGPVKEVTP